MQERLTWRQMLGQFIANPDEKQRIAHELDVNPITLTRWVNAHEKPADASASEAKKSAPRPHLLRQLVNSIPQYREEFVAAIQKEFPDFKVDVPLSVQLMEEKKEIPSHFYKIALQAAAQVSGSLRFLTISDHILLQMMQQLDPDRLGLSILLVQCVRPAPHEKVKSVRERVSLGTPPWATGRDERTYFLGAESLAGYAIMQGAYQKIDDLQHYTGLLPVHAAHYERSVLACPIRRESGIAGCLLVSSTQASYFSPARIELVQDYSNLAMLMFEETDFYPLNVIDLRLMPDAITQGPFLFRFNEWVEKLMREGEITNRLDAEWEILRRIEQRLIYWYSALVKPGPIPPSSIV